MTKSLSESAAEILRASMNAGKEAMQKLPAQEDDLGGSTNETPEGDEVGKKAAAAVKEAPKPGQTSTAGDKKMNSVKSAGLAKPVVGDVDPDYDGGGAGNESVELNGEVIAEEELEIAEQSMPKWKMMKKKRMMKMKLR